MKKLWYVLCVAVAFSALIGCAAQSQAPGPVPTTVISPSPTLKPTSAPALTPTPTTPAPATVKTGGVLRFWAAAAPAGGFDVHRKLSYAPILGRSIFSNLVIFDPTKSEVVPQNIVGDLAEKWETSADGKTWTFYLRKGVKWHDGVVFNADDVVYSITKMMDPKTSAMPSTFPNYDKVEKVDDYTVKVYLKAPSPSFLIQMTGPYTSILSKHLATVDFRSTDFLVGTGPFKFKTAQSGVSYEVQRNPDYFKKDAQGRQLPYLDGWVVTIISDRSAQVDAFAAGRVDMTSSLNGIANQQVLDRFKSQITNAVIVPQLTQQGTLVWFNLNYAPLKDARVRKAIALLVDPKQMATVAYGGETWADYNHYLMPGNFGLPKADADKLLGRDLPFEQRVTMAQKLMAEAGFADGFPLKQVCRSLAEETARATTMDDLLRRHLKINSTLSSVDSTEARRLRDAGDFHMYWDQALNLLGDPDELISNFMTGKNFMKYSNPDLDKLWLQQSQTMDIAERIKITQQIERTLYTDLPAVPTTFLAYFNAWQPYVKGFTPQNASYGSNIKYETVWLDK